MGRHNISLCKADSVKDKRRIIVHLFILNSNNETYFSYVADMTIMSSFVYTKLHIEATDHVTGNETISTISSKVLFITILKLFSKGMPRWRRLRTYLESVFSFIRIIRSRSQQTLPNQFGNVLCISLGRIWY